MSRVERHAQEEKTHSKKRRSASTDIDKGAVATEDKGSRKGKKTGKITPLGRFFNFIGTLIMIVTIIICLVLTMPRFAGIETYVVISGSMEPAIPVGSMVYARETNPSQLETGDVIVFYSTEAAENAGSSGRIPVTHRVVENDIENGEIITKGDANEQNDLRPVIYNNVVGKMILHVPYLGYLASPLATVTGKAAMAMVILAGYLLTEVGSRMRRA